MKNLILTIIFILPFYLFAQKGNTYRVFYLGGQSNMDGFGYTKDLPEELTKTNDSVYIFHGNPAADGDKSGGLGKWETLKPGHGDGFSSNGKENKLSNRFGIELTFAKQLKKLYPNEKIALIKYSRGGTSLDSLAAADFGSWEPDFNSKDGINQYDHFLKTVNSAFSVKDIDNDGKEDILKPTGIIWMQGEADSAFTEEIANDYYNKLKRMMDLIRAALRTDDLPVVIGKISDSGGDIDGKVWTFGELVQYAQEKYTKTDKNATIVRSTENYDYSDTWHYNSEGYIDLGIQFANAVFKLIKK